MWCRPRPCSEAVNREGADLWTVVQETGCFVLATMALERQGIDFGVISNDVQDSVTKKPLLRGSGVEVLDPCVRRPTPSLKHLVGADFDMDLETFSFCGPKRLAYQPRCAEVLSCPLMQCVIEVQSTFFM